MKIAITAEQAELSSEVAARFGQAPYLLIVDTETMEFKAITNPGTESGPGSGVRMIVQAVAENVETVLTGYCSPNARNQLISNGIRVITGIGGTVEEVIAEYKAGKHGQDTAADEEQGQAGRINKTSLISALRSSVKQSVNILPVLIGVVLCIGLFNTFVSEDALASVFSGNAALDTLWGACFGSILAGNPINSYVIGETLLSHGVSLFAVTALIVTWVTVGLVQLPAEIASLGYKFALLRNGLCFVLAIPVAILTVTLTNLFVG